MLLELLTKHCDFPPAGTNGIRLCKFGVRTSEIAEKWKEGFFTSCLVLLRISLPLILFEARHIS
jgi:hypothetical protein